jgi:hypothetical protein
MLVISFNLSSAQIGSYSIRYILTSNLQIDADPDPYPAYHYDVDPVPTF